MDITGLYELYHLSAEWFMQTITFQNEYRWMARIFFVLLVTAAISVIAGIVIGGISRQFSKTKNLWDDVFIISIKAPIKLFIWVQGIFYAVKQIDTEYEAEIFKDVASIKEIIIVVILAWALNRFIKRGKDQYTNNKLKNGESYDETSVQVISKLLRISVLISALLIALQNLGISISGVLAFGGVGGIAIGFAAKDMLANFFGALIIYFDKPFKVGEWIRSPDHEIEGTVKEVGWRMTTIETFDKRPLYVPNSLFTNIVVETPSRMSHRRIYETIGVRYDDIAQVNAITDKVREMIDAHDEIDQSQLIMVYFNAFNASSCDFFIYCFTKTTIWADFHAVKHDVLLKIAAIIDDHDAQIAFPTQTLHVDSMPEMLQQKSGQNEGEDE